MLEPDNCTSSVGSQEGSSESSGHRLGGAAASAKRPPCFVHVQEGRTAQRRSVQGHVEMWKDSWTVSTPGSLVIASTLLYILLQPLMILKPSHKNGELPQYKYPLHVSSGSVLLSCRILLLSLVKILSHISPFHTIALLHGSYFWMPASHLGLVYTLFLLLLPLVV